MKQLLLVFAVLLTLASCDKQASNQLAKEEMNAEELKARYGIVFDDLSYGQEAARNNKPKANAVVVVVWFNDLTLTESGGVLTTSISPNAVWAGVQKFVDTTTVEGAVSVCNWNYWFAASDGSETCNTTGTGFYRSWTSDANYDVHISSFLSIP